MPFLYRCPWRPIKTDLKATSCGFLDHCHHFPAFPNRELEEMALDVLFLAAIEKCQEHHRAVYGNRLLTPAHIQGNFQCCDFSKSVAVQSKYLSWHETDLASAK